MEIKVQLQVVWDLIHPVKKITSEIIDEAIDEIMKPMASAMVKEGVPFTGFLYGGLM